MKINRISLIESRFNNCLSERSLLITGASGFLGSYLCRGMANIVNAVPVTYRTPLPKYPKAVSINLGNRKSTHTMLNKYHPAVILHAAAETNVDRCQKEPSIAIESNIDTTYNLASWVRENSPDTALIYVSTDQLYDGVGPHKEDDVNPRNVYAVTKYAAEGIVRSCDNHLVLRANFLGWTSKKIGFANWLVQKLQNHENVTLVDDVFFNPLFAEDFVYLIMDLVGKRIHGTLNIGASGSPVSKADFGTRFVKMLGLDVSLVRIGKVNELKLAAFRPSDMSMNVNATEKVLNYTLPSLNDTLVNLVNEFSRH